MDQTSPTGLFWSYFQWLSHVFSSVNSLQPICSKIISVFSYINFQGRSQISLLANFYPHSLLISLTSPLDLHYSILF